MRIKGFSLFEMILVLGVLIALMTMIFPDVTTFLNYQKEKNEQLSMLQIKQAMNAYAKKCRSLPPANITGGTAPYDVCGRSFSDVSAEGTLEFKWDSQTDEEIPVFAKELSSVSTLSARDFMFDAYGNPRTYRFGVLQKTFRNGQMDVYYATITSNGRDKQEDSSTDPETAATPDWQEDFGLDPIADIELYAGYTSVNDDEVIKFTDEALKLELYDERVAQLKRIGQALDSFAYGMRSQDLLDGVDSPELIYYPRSLPDDATNPSSVYYAKVLEAMTDVGLGNVVNTANVDDVEALMRLIGLPESYAYDPVTGERIGYVSNPDAANPCTGSGATEAPFPPIRVSAIDACN